MNFVGASYEGQRTADAHRFDGLGQFVFANGDVYVGGMRDGAFHGNGILFFRARHRNVLSSTATCTAASSSAAAASEPVITTKTTTQTTQSEPSLRAFLSGGASAAPAGENVAESEVNDEWAGQYRGVWQNGTHVSGSYVFGDGLVYGSVPSSAATTLAETTKKGASPTAAVCANAPDRTSTAFWAYCQSDDHRLWSEHLRHLVPVFPYETVLGGAKVINAHAATAAAAARTETEARTGAATPLWMEVPMLVPSSRLVTLTPPSFSHGQPQSGAEVPPGWWTSTNGAAAAREVSSRPSTANPSEPLSAHSRAKAVASTTDHTAAEHLTLPAMMALTTPPLLPEHDPDQIVRSDGSVEYRSRRVDDPTLTLRFADVETLLQTGGRVLTSQPHTHNQQHALASLPAEVVCCANEEARGMDPHHSGTTRWANRDANMAAIASCPTSTALPTLHASSQHINSTRSHTKDVTVTAESRDVKVSKPFSPRPPSQRPLSGSSGSVVRAQQAQRHRACSPTPMSAPTTASPLANTVDQTKSDTEHTTGATEAAAAALASSPVVPNITVTLVAKTTQLTSSEEEEDEARDAETRSPDDAAHALPECPPRRLSTTQAERQSHSEVFEAEAEVTPDVPVIVLNTIPRISQLSDESDDEQDVDVEAVDDVLEDADREVHAATTLQGFARMMQAKREYDVRQQAVEACRASEADEDPGNDAIVQQAMKEAGGWVEEAEYSATEL